MNDDNNEENNKSPKSLDTFIEGVNEGNYDENDIIQNRGYDLTKDLSFKCQQGNQKKTDTPIQAHKKDSKNNSQTNSKEMVLASKVPDSTVETIPDDVIDLDDND